jgi:hypothetical protein
VWLTDLAELGQPLPSHHRLEASGPGLEAARTHRDGRFEGRALLLSRMAQRGRENTATPLQCLNDYLVKLLFLKKKKLRPKHAES